jgi:glutamyl-tRNA(Gln) amidotransferase subunit E
MEDYRFGTEISSKVEIISGLKGIIHSDEDLKKYKFTEEEVKKVKNELNFEDTDCFVLVLGDEEEVEKALEIIVHRINFAFKGVPPETRRALENGNTEFLRELHGGARLYPDTDTQAIINTKKEIQEIQENLPEYPWHTIKEYSKNYKIDEKLIKDLIFSGNLSLFNELLEIFPENPTLIMTTLLATTIALRRDGKNIDNISDDDYKEIFTLLKKNEISKEAVIDILTLKADAPELTIDQIKKKLKIESISIEELRKIIKNIINKNTQLIKEKEMRAMGPLMGEMMKEVRGKIDGAIISDELKKAISIKLKGLK